jgi:CDP-glucose 4,6-dehydratase
MPAPRGGRGRDRAMSDPTTAPTIAPRGAVDPAFWRGRRVLVTGHSGFKGAWLVLWLRSLGAHVIGFDSGRPTQPSLFELARLEQEVEAFDGDVRDAEALASAVSASAPEIVFHMAAQPLVRRSYAEPRDTYATNVMGTVNLLDAVRRHGEGVRAVVCVTSDKCYENREWDWGYREGEPLGGRDPYSSSKACAELVTSAFRDSFFAGADAPRVASARAGNVIGGGDWGIDRLVPDIVRAALAGEPVRVRSPAAIRPWQHVLNPLSGYLVLAQALVDDAANATAWNFGPDERDARPVSWLVERIAALWPEGLGWDADEDPHPPEAHYLKLDSSRARGRLGWRPPVALERALESIVEWHCALREQADMRAVTLRQLETLQQLSDAR